MTEEVPRLFDLQAMAQMWSVSPHTIRKWVKEGRLRPIRLCRRLLFDPNECVRFLASARSNGRILESPPLSRHGADLEQNPRDTKKLPTWSAAKGGGA